MVFGRGRKCNKLIKYQDNKLKFDVSFGGGGEFDLGVAFEKEPQNMVSISEAALSLDDHMYGLCEDYKKIKEDSPLFASYLDKREKVRKLLTGFRLTLAAFLVDKSNVQRTNLDNAVKNVQKFMGFENLVNQREQIESNEGISEEINEKFDLRVGND